MDKSNFESDTQVKNQGSASGPVDVLADLEATLNEVAKTNPRIDKSQKESSGRSADLKAILEVSLAVNSSLVLDDILQSVMTKSIELMQAERGLIMLLNDHGELQVRSAYNLCKEEMMEEDFKISNSITSKVASTGKSVYTSDALSDERFSNQQSVLELHLRSIMSVPLKVKDEVIGVIYLDNSNQSKMFLKSDLYLFELYAQMVSNALHNAKLYQSLLVHKRYNESVIKTAPFGTIVIDSEGHLVTINSVGLEIFDFNKDNIITQHESKDPTCFVDLLLESERPHWQHMINGAMTTKVESSDPRYFHNTGYFEKALSIKILPISHLPNGGDGVIIAVEDITEKVMCVNIDRDKMDKVKFNAQAITENVHKIKRFVDNLMDFSKPESEYIIYDIKHLVEDLLFSLRVQPRFKRIHFSIELDPNMPNVEIDVGLIQQVLMNLLNNAADAIEDRIVQMEDETAKFKRKISIETEYDTFREKAIIKITDNGRGMTDDTLQKIFNLHFTTKKGGHGLGLANCKKIIEQHNGDLLCDSQFGKGTTFRIILPRLQPKKQKSS